MRDKGTDGGTSERELEEAEKSGRRR